MPIARNPTPRHAATRRGAVVVIAAAIVHVVSGAAALAADPKAKPKAAPPAADAAKRSAKTSTSSLPAAVEEMRDGILAAVRSGDIEDLKLPLAWNEIAPDIADEKVADAIAYWRKASSDGAGREILAALGTILELPHAVVPLGRDLENNKIYVWPAVAERPIRELTPPEQVQLLRVVPAAEAKRMLDVGRYTGWRLAIGADGTWHSFRRVP
jgi:hypothetical protein